MLNVLRIMLKRVRIETSGICLLCFHLFVLHMYVSTQSCSRMAREIQVSVLLYVMHINEYHLKYS